MGPACFLIAVNVACPGERERGLEGWRGEGVAEEDLGAGGAQVEALRPPQAAVRRSTPLHSPGAPARPCCWTACV